MNQNAAGYGLADFKFALRKRWTSVVLTGSVLLIAGSYLTVKKPVSYQVGADVSIAEETKPLSVYRAATDVQPMTPDLRKKARNEILSGTLFLKVIDKHELTKRWNLNSRVATLDRLKRKVSVIHDANDETLQVNVSDTTREGAATLANAIAEEFVAQKAIERQLDSEERIRNLDLELESRRKMVASIERSLRTASESGDANLQETEALRQDLVHQSHLIRSLEARHQLAVVEYSEARPTVSLLAKAVADEATLVTGRWYLPSLLGLLGIAIGMVLVGALAIRSAPLQVATDLRESLDLLMVGFAPVLASPLSKLSRAADSIVEPYRYLRHGLSKLPAGDCSIVSFVSADDDSEMAQVVSNLSVIMAEAGHTVLLIDGDLRNPKLYELFDAANHPGLSDYLTGEMRLEETVVKTRKNNLWFMPSGPVREDPSGLFSGKRMDDLLYEMKSRFDYLLVTSPSPLSYTEAAVVSGIADHTIAVTSYKRHSGKMLKQLKQALESSGGLLSGVALSQLLTPPTQKSDPKPPATPPANEVVMERKKTIAPKPTKEKTTVQDDKPRAIS